MSMADPRRGAGWLVPDMRIFEEKKPRASVFRAALSASSLSKYARRGGDTRAAPVGGSL
ncbi:hypothetical protein [Salipiger mangrovisoli]|uniref:Uncharacterized protein n=1 Tax=Salipiger mangrovisoli TaxID=2865933 RepID=A0ABR9X2Q5_9RHOB|nr:hypothetical protein [Salipiger mangrovisoli]MBE9637786.1 hypothetical protein [Salipiger mangrovisoli]